MDAGLTMFKNWKTFRNSTQHYCWLSSLGCHTAASPADALSMLMGRESLRNGPCVVFFTWHSLKNKHFFCKSASLKRFILQFPSISWKNVMIQIKFVACHLFDKTRQELHWLHLFVTRSHDMWWQNQNIFGIDRRVPLAACQQFWIGNGSYCKAGWRNHFCAGQQGPHSFGWLKENLDPKIQFVDDGPMLLGYPLKFFWGPGCRISRGDPWKNENSRWSRIVPKASLAKW